jgi:hypothetical protein
MRRRRSATESKTWHPRAPFHGRIVKGYLTTLYVAKRT